MSLDGRPEPGAVADEVDHDAQRRHRAEDHEEPAAAERIYPVDPVPKSPPAWATQAVSAVSV
jgi:hypothetical protein